MADLETVRKIALSLPGVEESTAFGKPAFKAGKEMIACVPSNKAAEPDSLVVRISFDRREELLEAAPDIYYLPGHYVGYPGVLVRLSRIRLDALEGLLRGAWNFVTVEKRRGRRGGGKR